MRLKRFLAALLSVTLAVPPAIIAQPSNLSDLPLVTGPLDTYGSAAPITITLPCTKGASSGPGGSSGDRTRSAPNDPNR